MENKIKLIWTIAIPFSFFCAGIHHIAYWSEFNINGLAFLEIGDIIKSFIQPFLYTSIVNLTMQAAVYVFTSTFVNDNHKIIVSGKSVKGMRICIGIYLIFVIVFSVVPVHVDKVKLIFLPFIYIPLAAIFLYKLLSPYINNRNILIQIICFSILLPTFSYTSGKYKALLIEENIKFQYVKLSSGYVKFIGKTGDTYVFCSLDNRKKHFVQKEEIPHLILSDY